jgi:hypothetical protein
MAIRLNAIALSGCGNGKFGRFMDHPILNWLPAKTFGALE